MYWCWPSNAISHRKKQGTSLQDANASVSGFYLKHFFGFMTLFFFDIVAIPSLANISGMISSGKISAGKMLG